MKMTPKFVDELRHSLLDLHKALLDAQNRRSRGFQHLRP